MGNESDIIENIDPHFVLESVHRQLFHSGRQDHSSSDISMVRILHILSLQVTSDHKSTDHLASPWGMQDAGGYTGIVSNLSTPGLQLGPDHRWPLRELYHSMDVPRCTQHRHGPHRPASPHAVHLQLGASAIQETGTDGDIRSGALVSNP